MKKYRWPVDGIGTKPGVYIAQKFDNKWIAQTDTVINGATFSAGDDIYKKAFGLAGHNGIDIAAPRGTDVHAPTDCYLIERTDKPTGFGLRISVLVELADRFHVIVFGHFLDFSIPEEVTWNLFSRSRPLAEGEVIGRVDSSGFSSGDHVHISLYEYDKNGNKLNANNGYGGAIDPMPYMKILLPKAVRYKKHPEEDIILRFPDQLTQQEILSLPEITELFQFDDYKYTMPMDKPPFFTP